MDIAFEETYLADLYYTGKTKDKSHRFQPDIVKRYVRCIDYLRAALKPEELYQYRSLNFEPLKGNKQGLHSLRVNDQYRVEFRIDVINDVATVYLCNICELSNHYK